MSDIRMVMVDLLTGKLHAVQPNTIVSQNINKNGDSMAGPLIVTEFTEDSHAVNKGYVDQLIDSLEMAVLTQMVSTIDGVEVSELNVNTTTGERDIALTLQASGQLLPDADALWSVTVYDGVDVIGVVEGTGPCTNFVIVTQTTDSRYNTATYQVVGLYNPGVLNLPFDLTVSAV